MIHRSPHDQYVKAILQHPETARAYFCQLLPEQLLATLNMEGMQQVSESFIDKELKETFSDLLYKVPMKGKRKEVYLSLLLEHKSSADPYVTVQIGHYIFSALIKQIRKGDQPTPVIPVLLYHGKDPMPYRTHRQLYENLGEEVLPFVPEYSYIYHDLQSTSEEEIAESDIKIFKSMFLLLKYAHDESTLLKLSALILGSSGNFFKFHFVYFLSLIKEKSKFMVLLNDLPDALQFEARNAYEAFILEGIEKGLKKGRAEGYEEGREEGREEGARNTIIQSIKGLFNNGISIEAIAKSLKLTEAEVKDILRENG